MNHHLNEKERALIRLINFFIKRTENTLNQGKLDVNQGQLTMACEDLLEKIHLHAEARALILKQRELLKNMIDNHSECPNCLDTLHLKQIGVSMHEKGWQCNVYKCLMCDFQFESRHPNNLWDMILFMENVEHDLDKALEDKKVLPKDRRESKKMIQKIRDNLVKLKPLIEASDQEYSKLAAREPEMEKMIEDFKNYLVLEKVKISLWNSNVGES